MYIHKTGTRFSKENRERMSKAQIACNKRSDVKKEKSLAMSGENNPQAICYMCFNSITGKSEEYYTRYNLKKFCKKEDLYLHLLLKIANKNQSYRGWYLKTKRIYEIRKEEFEKNYRYYVYVYLDSRKKGLFKFGSYSFNYEPFMWVQEGEEIR